jgi:hypothetical protein
LRPRPGGGIGRRSRLKICRSQGCAGSIPVPGTIDPLITSEDFFIRSVHKNVLVRPDSYRDQSRARCKPTLASGFVVSGLFMVSGFVSRSWLPIDNFYSLLLPTRKAFSLFK